jgi:hypothetical protein
MPDSLINTKPGETIMKWIQGIALAACTGLLFGAFNRINDMNDRIIRMEERAIANTQKIEALQSSLNRVQMKQEDASDRMTRLEIQITQRPIK